MERGPIFVGGFDRSGKTYMRLMLAAHPNIAMTRRTNWWGFFYKQYGELGRRENFERCLAALLRYKHVALLQPDAARIRREFWQGEASYARLFALFHEHYAERAGKPRWGDQTGLIERYAAPIFAAYAGARMIHMVRDPRDCYEAALTRRPNGRGRVGGVTAGWLYSVGLAQRNLRRYPDRYLVVRYEALVTQPEATLHEVCAFLDEPYEPAMLAMGDAPRFRDQCSNNTNDAGSAPRCPLSPSYIGRYRQAIAADEIAFIQLHAGRLMRAYGYSLDPIRFTPGERLRFALAGWPLNMARMLSWRALELAQHHFPARLGRKPRASKGIGRQEGTETA